MTEDEIRRCVCGRLEAYGKEDLELIAGTEILNCIKCGDKIIASPSTVLMVKKGAEPWCSDCVRWDILAREIKGEEKPVLDMSPEQVVEISAQIRKLPPKQQEIARERLLEYFRMIGKENPGL